MFKKKGFRDIFSTIKKQIICMNFFPNLFKSKKGFELGVCKCKILFFTNVNVNVNVNDLL